MFIKTHYQESEKTAHRIPEEISENHVSDKGLLPRICKEYLQLNNEKTTKLKNGQSARVGS